MDEAFHGCELSSHEGAEKEAVVIISMLLIRHGNRVEQWSVVAMGALGDAPVEAGSKARIEVQVPR